MAIVNLQRYRDQRVNELLRWFTPSVDYSNYQVKPRPDAVVVGGSAINNVEASRLHAVNELRRWMRPST